MRCALVVVIVAAATTIARADRSVGGRVIDDATGAPVVGALVAYLYDNLQANQRDLDLPRGYGFLDEAAGFRIAYSDFSPGDTVWQALLVGLRNTISVAVVGIVLTLVLGTLVGIARLSSNWLVRKAAGAYVEAVRNVPPLLVIIFVNSVALTSL